MIAQLTRSERQGALILLLATTIIGLAMAIVGSKDPLGAHGGIVILCGIAGIFGGREPKEVETTWTLAAYDKDAS